LYLLDANDLLNNPADRGITAKLYGGGSETRLLQELVLGVGGWRLLEALDLRPTIAHLNEGHAAFVVLERARSLRQRAGLSFPEALWATRAGNVFTSHTPVDAGFDRFEPRLIERNLLSSKSRFSDLGVSPRALLGMGRRAPDDDTEPFNMAYLAMRGCAFANGVSRLHGEVSRLIFSPLFTGWPQHEVPIGHVTNGVHVPSWDSRAADELWTEACGKERWRRSVEGLDHIVSSLSDERLWSMRSTQRAELVGKVRERLRAQLLGRGVLEGEAIAAAVLDPSALTLGFARRFAEYKRPTLLLRDPARLARLLSNPLRPVQIVVAGKAHPDDDNGKRMIAEWLRFAECPDMRRRVVFLEDYDIGVAAQLTQGVDVWVNTPRRPWEACGTSGMKVLVNGGLNLSVRDGWWAEVDASDVGWGLGDAAAPRVPAAQCAPAAQCDAADAGQLYTILENAVVPEFYQRDRDGLPRHWIARIRASMARLAPRFSANRMLSEYLELLYLPAGAGQARRSENNAEVARSLARWEHLMTNFWHTVRFGAVEHEYLEGGGVRFRTWISSGEVPLDYVRVELYADATRDAPAFRKAMTARGHGHPDSQCFELDVVTTRPLTDFTPRILPHHSDARLPFELPLIRWQR
jgi:starch phosphorylase